MAHAYTDTKPFNRVPYIRQVHGSTLEHREREILLYLFAFCEPDLTMPFKAYNSGTIATTLKRHLEHVRQGLAELQRAKLLTKVVRRRRVHWQLPDESKIVGYSPRRKK